jgi:uncharacterized membrane protein|tara:strand:+ start:3053 stop:3463 length:411 start_codon:yes stop_codon:yes gene_type:complete
MIVKKTRPGFALVEVVVVALLLGGAFIVFIEALNHTKIMQVKSEVKTIQTVLLNSKINQIRNTSFVAIYAVNNFLEFESNPGYFYKITIKHTDQTFTTIYDNTTTDFKLITIEIRHGSGQEVAPIMSDTFVVSNII